MCVCETGFGVVVMVVNGVCAAVVLVDATVALRMACERALPLPSTAHHVPALARSCGLWM